MSLAIVAADPFAVYNAATPKLPLRDVFALVTIAALSLGCVDRRRTTLQNRELEGEHHRLHVEFK